MRIVIIGYSGAGKSTLAAKLGQHYQIDVLHLDTLQFLPNWQERPREDFNADLADFLSAHENWVIDGNYSQSYYRKRMELADQIIFMNFSRWSSLWRAFKRSRQFKHQTRDSMAAGCVEKFDWEFIRWIIWDGRRKSARTRYTQICHEFVHKVTILTNQKEINSFLDKIKAG